MGVKSNIHEVIAKLSKQTAKVAPNSPHLKEALTRIGLYVTTLAKMNARRQGILDKGRLINSIRYEFFRRGPVTGILIGSFNVKYAAMNEFGGIVTPQMRKAMFAAMRQRGAKKAMGKGVIVGNRWRARPYLRPAFTQSRTFMIDTLRAAVTFAQKGGT